MTRLSKKQRKRLLLEHRYPNTCLDDEHRDWEREKDDLVISRFWATPKYPVDGTGEQYLVNVYKCSICGKEYNREPAMA